VNKSGVVSLNELQQTLNKYCQKDINEFVEDIVEAIADIYNSKNMTFTEFESTIERDDLEHFLDEEVKNDISMLDKDLLIYYYKNKGDSRKSSFNAFLNKLSTKFRKTDVPDKMKMTKNISSIEVSKERLAEVLKLLSVELDQANINLEDKIYTYDKNGILTEKEFEELLRGARLNLTSKDVSTLVNKYYNTIDKMVYAKQLLSDLKEYAQDDRSSQRSSKRKAASIKSVAKFINKNNKEKNVVDEMLMTDKNYEGYLSLEDIKKSFHNAGVKLSGSQVTDILAKVKKDRDKKYDYMELLVSLFGQTSQIKRFQERIKQRSLKQSDRIFESEKLEGDHTLKLPKKSRYDERLGLRRERMNSMSSARSSPRSGMVDEERKSKRSSTRSRGDPSPRSGRSRRGSRSSKSRGSPDHSFESGRARSGGREGERVIKLNREASDKVGAGREISV
jgi:Ca2+-binding EF-hand superfamily protein